VDHSSGYRRVLDSKWLPLLFRKSRPGGITLQTHNIRPIDDRTDYQLRCFDVLRKLNRLNAGQNLRAATISEYRQIRTSLLLIVPLDWEGLRSVRRDAEVHTVSSRVVPDDVES
jgi:hypothetical protein